MGLMRHPSFRLTLFDHVATESLDIHSKRVVRKHDVVPS